MEAINVSAFKGYGQELPARVSQRVLITLFRHPLISLLPLGGNRTNGAEIGESDENEMFFPPFKSQQQNQTDNIIREFGLVV